MDQMELMRRKLARIDHRFEADLQTRIIEDLVARRYYPIKNIACNKEGWPDITVHSKGIQEFFIEVKDKGKKPKPLQEVRHKEIAAMGKKVYVIDSWEQYLDLDL